MELLRKLLNNVQTVVVSIFSTICSIFSPAIPIIITSYAFIFADIYYGYKVSKKYGRKQFESNKLWRTVRKLRDATILTCLAVLLDKYVLMTYETLASTKIAALTVIIAEIISLAEAFRALHPNALLSKILRRVIRSKAEKYLDVDLSDIIDIK